MKLLAVLVLLALAARGVAQEPAPAAAPPQQPKAWLEMPGGEGPGAGKHVVLIAGDEEYRSEEALPMLARILSAHHGFRCTVLFSQDANGTVNPNEQTRIPGMAALDDADLLVLFTRFRHLPDEDMAHLAAYVERGQPVFGIRTATHAFAYAKDSGSRFASWSWDGADPEGGFGRKYFGTSWVAHLGHHSHESTRGVPAEAARGNPVLRGVADVWGPTDVYAVTPLPADAAVLLEGQILSGMQKDSAPVEDARNAPRTAIAWTRQIARPEGPPQRTACSTIGAAQDLESEDLRRLFVNLCYWCTGLQDKIPERNLADVVGTYEPRPFGFLGFQEKSRPADFDGGAKPATR